MVPCGEKDQRWIPIAEGMSPMATVITQEFVATLIHLWEARLLWQCLESLLGCCDVGALCLPNKRLSCRGIHVYHKLISAQCTCTSNAYLDVTLK